MEVEVQEMPDPAPGPDQAVVDLRVGGICGSDLHVVRGEPREGMSRVPGHEPAGVVSAVGENVDHIEVGRRVSVYHYVSCGHCQRCRQGNWMWCAERGGLGSHVAGSCADKVLVNARNCLPLPDELSFIDGALIACGAGTSWSSMRKLDPGVEDTAVVFGLGPVGLIGVAMLRAFGARVVGVGRRAGRVRLAGELGAERVIDIDEDVEVVEAIREQFDGGVSVAYETSGAAVAQQQMVRCMRRFGRAVCVGLGSSEPAVNFGRLAGRQLTLMGSFVMNIGQYEDLADFMVRHLDLGRIVTHRYPIEEAQEAFEMADAGDCAKVVLEWRE